MLTTTLAGENRWTCAVKHKSGDDAGQDQWDGPMIDPSGYVLSAAGHFPIQGATVTLQRTDPSTGAFATPPTGDSATFTPAVNPQRTNPLGHYGWDVVPGHYRIVVTRHGCRSLTSRTVSVPPPVTDLTVALVCHGIRRARTSVSASCGRRHAEGNVTLRIGVRRFLAPLDARGHAMVSLSGLAAGRHRLRLSYPGDGGHRSQRATISVSVHRR